MYCKGYYEAGLFVFNLIEQLKQSRREIIKELENSRMKKHIFHRRIIKENLDFIGEKK